jgi:polyhydroxybutyrate depolymerase
MNEIRPVKMGGTGREDVDAVAVTAVFTVAEAVSSRLRTRFAALVFLALALNSCGSNSSPRVASSPTPREPQAVTLHVGGLERTYYVLFPANRTGLVPLVLALHGYTQSVGGLETETRLNDEAAAVGFVLAYPAGINQSWNAGGCCADAEARNVDDVAFIKQVIDQLVRGGRVDPKRIFATGISNGGMMDYRLACELSDRIAAIASVSGALELDTCSPARTVSVLEMHGTDDSQVPLAGGTLSGLGTFPPTMSTMRRWVTIDRCTADPTVSKTDITETSTWTGCRDGSTVVLVVVNGGGHTFWLDHVPAQLNVNQYIWGFFSGLPSRT